MNQLSASKNGVTSTGFSRNAFGCCARHALCEMGKAKCFYEDIDPEVLTLCAAYKRQHNKKEHEILDYGLFRVENKMVVETEENLNEENDGQLSLF